ncbi:MAG: glycosyl transferase family 2 [Legionellales bacterium]|nr:MAG: glycosyl transferase family 2 [Legionellales bacterium]
MDPIAVSVIVTTYNWPEALRLVLQALLQQQCAIEYEIVVADDGSAAATGALINISKNNAHGISITHVWQEDLGFRAALCRNKAVAAARGTYLIFIDGDCIVPRDFVQQHYNLAQPGYFVPGNRILLCQGFTAMVLRQQLPVYKWHWGNWLWARIRGQCNRVLPCLRLPLGRLRLLQPRRWRGAKGCNLAMYRQDLALVHGWDSSYAGWGYEDSNLVIRLINSRIYRKDGRFKVAVLHLWHPENNRANAAANLAGLPKLHIN